MALGVKAMVENGLSPLPINFGNDRFFLFANIFPNFFVCQHLLLSKRFCLPTLLFSKKNVCQYSVCQMNRNGVWKLISKVLYDNWGLKINFHFASSYRKHLSGSYICEIAFEYYKK